MSFWLFPVKITKKNPETSEITRVLKTDEELAIESASSPERIRRFRAIQRNRAALMVPEMLDLMRSIAFNDENPVKERREAAKTILMLGLGPTTPEDPNASYKPIVDATTAELDAILDLPDKKSDSGE